jgi:ketosteroid isomerase-like protein
MKFIIILLSFFPILAKAQASKNELAIQQLLHQQEIAWNNGNLDAFMDGYWKNDSLQFIGKNGPIFGYNQTLSNYKAHYATKVAMGHFTSTILAMQPLGKKYYYVTGKWHLARENGNIEGYYTLLFKKIKGKWFIIADHSA